MIALVQHVDHGPIAIHRTWLAIDGSGKASFREPRMSLGPIGGAAIIWRGTATSSATWNVT
jgi:putative DNA primase/helicase